MKDEEFYETRIQNLTEELESKNLEIKKKDRVLEFFADEVNYSIHRNGEKTIIPVFVGLGATARDILTRYKKGENYEN